MRFPFIIAIVALAAGCSPPAQAPREAGAPAQPQAQQQAAPAVPAVDPAAIVALERMSAYLRTLQNFEVRATTLIDEVDADTGQKLQFEGQTTYRVARPHAFFIDTRTDRRHRQFYYDGSEFTIYSPRMNLYAQAPAPGTIAEAVAVMENQYNIDLPLKDLFYWGTAQADTSNITSAQHIGFATVDGVETDQFAFRQGAVDWQIWIERGDRPMPRRLVITSREEEGQPQFSSDLTWNANPRFSNATFAFSPPAQARQIRFASAEPATVRQQ